MTNASVSQLVSQFKTIANLVLIASVLLCSACVSADEIEPSKFGDITGVGETTFDSPRVSVGATANLGTDDGVQVADTLFVFRGKKRIGHLVVNKVSEETCTGRLIVFKNEKPATKACRVFLDSTIVMATKILAGEESKFDGKKLARLHAVADEKLGIKRLLAYGELGPEPQFDKKTGIEFYGVAGCKVTEAVKEFADHYNEIVTANHKRSAVENSLNFVEPSKGTVTKLSRYAAPNAGFPGVLMPVIDLGVNSGLSVGEALGVYRDGRKIGYVNIKDFTEKGANTLFYGYNDAQIMKGDFVLRDTTVNLAGALVNAEIAEAEARRLAKLHFEADSKLGFKRILSFGKGPAGSDRKDEATGLPLVMAGGCIVSEPMLAFIKEYNRLMKELTVK